MSITVAALELIPETSAAEQLVADAYAIDASIEDAARVRRTSTSSSRACAAPRSPSWATGGSERSTRKRSPPPTAPTRSSTSPTTTSMTDSASTRSPRPARSPRLRSRPGCQPGAWRCSTPTRYSRRPHHARRRDADHPAPDTVYGLDPYLRERPATGDLRPSGGLLPFTGLRPVDRRPEDHPTHADVSSPATEDLATPD